jgi:hypothetical protein
MGESISEFNLASGIRAGVAVEKRIIGTQLVTYANLL